MIQEYDMGEILPHYSVLYQEVLNALQPTNDGRYVDGTVGAGGHAAGILKASQPSGKLLGLDVDPQALEIARKTLAPYQDRTHLIKASYTTLDDQLRELGWEDVNGIILDFGVSSMQLDTPERGFSFLSDAPLDMRFDPDNPICAYTLVNELPESELAEIISKYGDERWARRIARGIVDSRPVRSTVELADIVVRATGSRYAGSRIHPATRTFQALRIAVNEELRSIAEVLPTAIRVLAPGGRMAVISFHSLEDRLVKQAFRRESQDCICPSQQLICTCGHKAAINELVRRPIYPGEEEISLNPRARSARLRIAEKRSGT